MKHERNTPKIMFSNLIFYIMLDKIFVLIHGASARHMPRTHSVAHTCCLPDGPINELDVIKELCHCHCDGWNWFGFVVFYAAAAAVAKWMIVSIIHKVTLVGLELKTLVHKVHFLNKQKKEKFTDLRQKWAKTKFW